MEKLHKQLVSSSDVALCQKSLAHSAALLKASHESISGMCHHWETQTWLMANGVSAGFNDLNFFQQLLKIRKNNKTMGPSIIPKYCNSIRITKPYNTLRIQILRILFVDVLHMVPWIIHAFYRLSDLKPHCCSCGHLPRLVELKLNNTDGIGGFPLLQYLICTLPWGVLTLPVTFVRILRSEVFSI